MEKVSACEHQIIVEGLTEKSTSVESGNNFNMAVLKSDVCRIEVLLLNIYWAHRTHKSYSQPE